MEDPLKRYNDTFVDLVREAATHALHSQEATVAMKNLETFSKVRPPEPEPEPTPDPVPTTRLGKVKAGLASALDNETTRVFIKAGGAFAGVAVVAYSTIHRDHVLERNALSQANQQSR